MNISYLEPDDQDRLCGMCYRETLDLLVREKAITKEHADFLFGKFAPVTIRGYRFLDSVRKLLGMTKEEIRVRFISIK